MPDSDRPAPQWLSDYPLQLVATTRWSDNDMYGHLNNAVYYELFDSAINQWLAEQTEEQFAETSTIGVVAESGCRFHSELAFPGPVTVGVRVERLGRSSVTYGLGLFDGAHTDTDDDVESCATGRWVHVYIDRDRRSAVPIPDALRTAMESLTTPF